MSRFNPTSYVLYRPLYPEKIFQPLIQRGLRRDDAFTAIDLGAGTGFATRSFLEVFPHAKVTLVEPHADMLKEAEVLLAGSLVQPEVIHAAAETFEWAPRKPVDLIFIGSAWHWMDAKKTIPRISSALKDGGWVHIFEYQFPKSETSPELNEWVRRQFNLNWKADQQVPRGKLKELVIPMIEDLHYTLLSETEFEHQTEFNLDQFLGMIFSQSRYLCFEEKLPLTERLSYREACRTQLSSWLSPEVSHPFRYKMSSELFKFAHIQRQKPTIS